MSCRRPIEKLQSAGRSHQKSQEGLYERLAAHEAASLALSAERIGAVNAVLAPVSGWDANGLKKLASSIATKPATIAVLITTEAPMLAVVLPISGSRDRRRRLSQDLVDQFRGTRRWQRSDGAGRWIDGRPASGARRRPDIYRVTAHAMNRSV
jgi:hypothetical protein